MKIRSIIILTLTLCPAFAAIGQVQPGGPLRFTLSEARDYALKNSPVLLNTARDVEIAKHRIWESTASGLPHADLSSAYSYSPKLAGITTLFDTTGTGGENPFGNFVFDPEDFKTTFSMDIRVNQLIFSGQYIVGLKAAKVYAGLSLLAHSKSKVGIVESITNTYVTALVARQSRGILDSSLTTLQKTLFESTEMYKNGFLESTDVDQLKILESNIKSSLSVTERQIELMERLLKFQMGIPIDEPIELADRIDPIVDAINLEAAILDSFRVEDNVDYKMLDTQEKLMQLNMQVRMAQFLPTLSGYYNRHEDFDRNFFNDLSPNMFGLSLSFPLWSSGERLSQTSQSRLELMKAKTNKKMMEENLLIQYETALSEFLSARDIYSMQKESRNLSRKIFSKSIIKFKEGVGSSLDLNQTQTQYFTAEGNYYNALISLVSAKSKLESLMSNKEY